MDALSLAEVMARIVLTIVPAYNKLYTITILQSTASTKRPCKYVMVLWILLLVHNGIDGLRCWRGRWGYSALHAVPHRRPLDGQHEVQGQEVQPPTDAITLQCLSPIPPTP